MSRATVFNVLDDLAEVGLVMRADAWPGATRYEAATSFHHHFVCKQCGSVADVPCTDEESLCLDPDGVAGPIDGAQIIFRGVCAECLDA
ncbi:MAG: transcriptional repressor [bacterium]|nr:transcriptional repressor [bacterium]